MLIEFSVKNFRSIKERQTLSMVSATGGELRQTNTMRILDGRLTLLRSVAIYGPNASGKTNLIRALQTMRRIVLSSAQRQRGDDIRVTPYLFDHTAQTQPCEFEVIFISDGIRYQYGFTATNKQILEEWLFAYPKGRSQTWIDRKFDQSTQKYEWGNTDKLTGTKQLWQEATRSNALFLSTAIQLNNTQLQPAFDWFKVKLKIVGLDALGPRFTLEQCEIAQSKQQIIDFLQAADFNIDDLEVESEAEDVEHLLEELPNASRERLAERLKDANNAKVKKFRVRTVHVGSNKERFTIDMNDESDGTQKFFAFAGPWLDVLEKGYVLIVDELNDNLHPKLVRFLVQMFHNPVLNQQDAQLIFTTHETSILSQDVFRRDQVWFTEKDKYNATTLYPLSDFSPRKETENLEKNYLQGRYGALPYFQDITNISEGRSEPQST
ncbi:MAG: ATP-binding protein [Caldilineaceae bacterium]